MAIKRNVFMQYPRHLARQLFVISLLFATGYLILSAGLGKQTAPQSSARHAGSSDKAIQTGQEEFATGSASVFLPALTKPDQATRAQIIQTIARQPLSFEANHGQADSQVKFISRGPGYGLLLMKTEAAIELRNAECGLRNERTECKRQKAEGRQDEELSLWLPSALCLLPSALL